MERGSYSKSYRRGPFFFKQINPLTKIEQKIYNELNSNPKIVKKYMQDIKNINIKCAKIYYVNKNLLIEKYVKGITVDYYINSDINIELKINIIKQILDLFKLSLNNNKIKIDWNLKNFIIKDNDIILVDYIPSLYLDNLYKIEGYLTKELYDLYLNYDIQLAGIIGYSIYPFIEKDKDKLMKIYNEIYTYANDIYKIDKTKNHIFVDRIILIEKYLDNKIDKKDFIFEFKKMSLSKIMKSKIK